MGAPTPAQLLAAVQAAGVLYDLAPGWQDRANAAPGTFDPSYVLLHHTANRGAPGDAPSLAFCVRGTYPPVRNCHFLISRKGIVHVVYALGAYHAGVGGPGQWGNGPRVPADSMNRYAYGIEIESKGTSLDPTKANGADGITTEQYTATAKLAAALLDLLGSTTSAAINHRTWAPRRKTDTLLDDAKWQARIQVHRKPKPKPPTPPKGDPDVITDSDVARIADAVWQRMLTTGFQKDGTYDAADPRTLTAGAALVEANGAAWRAAQPEATA